MSVIFSSSFSGSGNVQGTYPEVSFFSPPQPWDTEGNVVPYSSGYIGPVTQSSVYCAMYGAGAPMEGVAGTFSFVTGSNVTPYEGLNGPGLFIEFGAGNYILGIRFYVPAASELSAPEYTGLIAGDWHVKIEIDLKISYFPITLAANTEYAGTFSLAADITAMLAGATQSLSWEDATGVAKLADIGISAIFTNLKFENKFNTLTIESVEVNGVVDTGDIDLTLPVPATDSGGTVLPPITMDGDITIPALAALIDAHDSTGEYAASLRIPGLTLIAEGGAYTVAALPLISMVSEGTVTGLAGTDVLLPQFTMSCIGTVAATGEFSLVIPVIGGNGYAGGDCILTLSAVTVALDGTTGGRADAPISLPALTARMIATAQNVGEAHIALPRIFAIGVESRACELPALRVLITGGEVIVPVYEAYTMNMAHRPQHDASRASAVITVDEVTRYTNFPFNQIVRYQDSYYGVADDALYLLEGTTDDGTPISWGVQTAISDGDSAQNKTVEVAYFGGRFGPANTVKLIVGEAGTEVYSYATPRDATAKNHRQAFGRGLKTRYFALAAEGDSDMALDTITLDILYTTRRI